jgi:hypothetical protein
MFMIVAPALWRLPQVIPTPASLPGYWTNKSLSLGVFALAPTEPVSLQSPETMIGGLSAVNYYASLPCMRLAFNVVTVFDPLMVALNRIALARLSMAS